MNTQPDASPNPAYLLSKDLSQEQLSSAIQRCLYQAEALATIATIVDVETIGVDTFNNYLWTLSDIVRETRWLYEYLINKY